MASDRNEQMAADGIDRDALYTTRPESRADRRDFAAFQLEFTQELAAGLVLIHRRAFRVGEEDVPCRVDRNAFEARHHTEHALRVAGDARDLVVFDITAFSFFAFFVEGKRLRFAAGGEPFHPFPLIRHIHKAFTRASGIAPHAEGSTSDPGGELSTAT